MAPRPEAHPPQKRRPRTPPPRRRHPRHRIRLHRQTPEPQVRRPPDITDRTALEKNFREKFEELNRVLLTDGEFARLLDKVVTPDVFTAARTLRERNAFSRTNRVLNGTKPYGNILDFRQQQKAVDEAIADHLRGAMNADDFRGYMLSFLFLRYLSDNYETAAKKELGKDYPEVDGEDRRVPPSLWYANNPDDIPVCILVLKKCKKPDDVLFINAAEHFVKGKRQNQLTQEHIKKIIDTYQYRKEEPRYARRVDMSEIEKNDFNLNISRYISTATAEEEIDLAATHKELVKIEKKIQAATAKHNEFLRELGLPLLP